jgi:hypothetical protein
MTTTCTEKMVLCVFLFANSLNRIEAEYYSKIWDLLSTVVSLHFESLIDVSQPQLCAMIRSSGWSQYLYTEENETTIDGSPALLLSSEG